MREAIKPATGKTGSAPYTQRELNQFVLRESWWRGCRAFQDRRRAAPRDPKDPGDPGAQQLWDPGPNPGPLRGPGGPKGAFGALGDPGAPSAPLGGQGVPLAFGPLGETLGIFSTP